MVRGVCILLLALVTIGLRAQDDEGEGFVQEGLLRAQGTIAVGLMHDNINNVYFHGDLEYYFAKNLSVRADIYTQLATLNDTTKFSTNNSMLPGLVYHFPTKSQFDPYFGIQPGVAVAQYKLPYQDLNGEDLFSDKALSPIVSGVIGINYYGPKIAHVFLNARLIRGKHISNYGSFFLDEVRISFGLGWNLSVKKN